MGPVMLPLHHLAHPQDTWNYRISTLRSWKRALPQESSSAKDRAGPCVRHLLVCSDWWAHGAGPMGSLPSGHCCVAALTVARWACTAGTSGYDSLAVASPHCSHEDRNGSDRNAIYEHTPSRESKG